MYFSDHTLWIIAQERQKQFLKEAQTRRLARLLRDSRKEGPTFWRQLSWRVGSLMITFGRRLQTLQNYDQAVPHYSHDNLEANRKTF